MISYAHQTAAESWTDSVREPAVIAPRAILDAGGDRGAVLSVGLHRLLGRLFDGQTLEVISRNIAARVEIPLWCARTGHDLQVVQLEGDESVYWITKITSRHRWSHL